MNSKLVSKIVSGTLLVSMVGYTFPVFAYTKDETVYSKMDNTGTNYKTVVSDHLKNTEDAETIEDLTDLLNVKNTSGDETYTQDGNKFTWNANKNDIYYQGDTTKELPIDLKVKYELDGNEISAQDIAGKSGKVKITLQYTNKEARTVTVNGKTTKMYVPFVVVAGTMIKDENAKNVEISSGKVVNDGTKTIVVGMAMPGLQESLGLSKNDVDIPSNIEITMDATDFETGSIVSYATPKVFDKDDLKVFDKLDSLYADANKLQSSMNQIQDGANTLKDGTTELATGANTLKDGTQSAYEGAQKIYTEVSKATNTNSSAIDQKTLASIQKQVEAQSKLSNEQIAQITALAKQGAKISDDQVAEIKKTAIAQADATIENQKATIEQQARVEADKKIDEKTIKEQAKKEVEKNLKEEAVINQIPKQVMDTLDENQKKLIISVAQQTAKETAATTAYTTAKKTAEETAATTAYTTAKKIAEETAVTTALSTAQKIVENETGKIATQVAQAITTQAATKTATTVATQVANQAQKTVNSQMTTLRNGLGQLTDGLAQVNNGATALADGTNQVSDGANTLADGITTFNEEGIKKICDVINGDVKDLDERVEKLTDLSKSYSTFTMVDGKNESDVKFIMVVDAVKKQEESEQDKENAVVENNTNTTTNNENENEGE